VRGGVLLLAFLAVVGSLILATMERVEVGERLREAELESHDTNILLFECAEKLDTCAQERHTMAVDCVKACAGCPEVAG